MYLSNDYPTIRNLDYAIMGYSTEIDEANGRHRQLNAAGCAWMAAWCLRKAVEYAELSSADYWMGQANKWYRTAERARANGR